MNCVCGTKLQKIKTAMDFFDRQVIVKEIAANYCPKCKEELFDSKQGDSLFEKVSKIQPVGFFESRKKIIRVGNSFAIPVSKDVAEFMQMKKGGEIQIKVKNPKKMIVEVA